jgi:DNA-binding winged helix-turn-helix (wHTH) protein/TolB-like protein/Flp pilus assembly protein TadD
MSNSVKHFYEFGPFRLDRAERLLFRDGQPLTLTPKAFDLLLTLVERHGHVIEKEELMNVVWPETTVEESNLTHHISVLRKTLGESASEQPYIETIPRRGYRFVAEVKKAGVPEPIAERESIGAVAQSYQSTEWRKSRLLFILLAGMGIAALSFTTYYLWPARTTTVATAPVGAAASHSTAPVRSIAVLPFKPLVGDLRDESLEFGMADTLIVRLGNLREMRVRPISSVRRFSGLEQDALVAGRALGVESVLDGQIQRAGDRIRVTARLLSVGDGKQLWAEQFDEKFTDVFSVQDSISRKVTSALALQLTGEEQRRLTKHYTENTEAYRLYVSGRFFWQKRTKEGLKKAIEYFEGALEKDPNYALAHVGLADSYMLLEEYAGTPASETVPKARAAVQRALQIDDSLAEAHASLGNIEWGSWNFSEAEREYRRAIELNPNYPTARHWYSNYLREVRGRYDEAMDEIKRAQQLDPLSPVISVNVALVHMAKGELEAAIEECKKIIELEPNFPRGHSFLSLAYQKQGRYEQAIVGYRKAVELSGRASAYLSELGEGYAVAGKRAEALVILKELEEKYAKGESNGIYLASVCAGLGEKDRAFYWLEKDFQARSGILSRIPYTPVFYTLRDLLQSDSRWGDLLRRMGVPQ